MVEEEEKEKEKEKEEARRAARIGGCAMTCLYVGLFREGGSGKSLSKDEESDPLGTGGAFDESRQRHEKHD